MGLCVAPGLNNDVGLIRPAWARGLADHTHNFISNTSFAGAIAGTPGTAATQGTRNVTTSGIVFSIVGTGTESSMYYIEIGVAGTATATFGGNYTFISNAFTSAVNGQTWTGSFYAKITGGDFTGISNVSSFVQDYDSGFSYLGGHYDIFVPTGSIGKQTSIYPIAHSTAANVDFGFLMNFINTGVVNLQIRLYQPVLSYQ